MNVNHRPYRLCAIGGYLFLMTVSSCVCTNEEGAGQNHIPSTIGDATDIKILLYKRLLGFDRVSSDHRKLGTETVFLKGSPEEQGHFAEVFRQYNIRLKDPNKEMARTKRGIPIDQETGALACYAFVDHIEIKGNTATASFGMVTGDVGGYAAIAELKRVGETWIIQQIKDEMSS
jgi:hypothetical protein